jgi:hypothetical protein
MKKILVILFALNSLLVFGQTNSSAAPTTEEEYNYMTKGYRVQIESGLDMKKGYSFQDIGSVTRTRYDFQFKALMRDAKKELAGIMVITHSGVSGKTYYVCITVNNNELLERYYKDISVWDSILLGHYCCVLSGIVGIVTSSANELEKNNKK